MVGHEERGGMLVRDFTVEGATYRYDMELITLEQANMAAEVLYYKRAMLEKPAAHVAQMLRAGGGDYLLRAFAYTLRRIDADGKPAPFSDQEYERALQDVRTMSVRTHADVEACVSDFFTRFGLESVARTVLSRADEVRVDLADLIASLGSNLAQINAAERPAASSNATES
ncbi:MAG: hypothetical protein HY962_07215 [Ignavibacteriae bacterium]|nr:hypothetical protein [Ignavibacteriota bacterium]